MSEAPASPGRPKSRTRRAPGANHRTAIYMSGEVLNAIAVQARVEGNSQSGLMSAIMSLVLITPLGEKLREVAKGNRHSLTQEINELLDLLLLSPIGKKLQQSATDQQIPLTTEIERNLTLFAELLPIEELARLAQATRSTPAQIVAELVTTLFDPPLSQKLYESAQRNRRTFAQEVERNLILFKDRIPSKEIAELAEQTQRTPDEMLTRLVLIGLESYKKNEIEDK